MGKTTGKKAKTHRKTKAAIAAGALASTIAATAAYRRRNARQPQPSDVGAGANAVPGATQQL